MSLITKSIQWTNFIIRSQKALPKKERRFQRKIEKFGGLDIQRRHSLYKLRLSAKTTEAEKAFGYILCWSGIAFQPQKGFFEPYHRICDFYLPLFNVAIEIDGGYHLAIKNKDDYKDMIFLKKRGVRTYRFTNEEVFTRNPKIFELLSRFNGTPECTPEVLRARADRFKKVQIFNSKPRKNKGSPWHRKSHISRKVRK